MSGLGSLGVAAPATLNFVAGRAKIKATKKNPKLS